MGGIWGTLMAGIFASNAINAGIDDGLIWGGSAQFGKQIAGIFVIGAFSFAATWGLGKLVDLMVGLRVSDDEEVVGLDISQHGERAYGGTLL